MKVLFITQCQYGKDYGNGGYVASYRNYAAACSFFGKENVEIFYLGEVLSIFERIISRAKFYYGVLTEGRKKEIVKIAKNIVIIDSSRYGKIAKAVKKYNPSINIITIFHNIEKIYVKEQQCGRSFMHRFCYSKIVEYNENLTCKYSDKIIVFNNRDNDNLQKFYKRRADAIIPITFPNKEINFNKSAVSQVPTALFLGSAFFPNIHGITWFIENILPFVNIKLQIVGKDMESLQSIIANQKLDSVKDIEEKFQIFGYVENLDEIMQDADFMVYPIFKGSGMKVKTCEALMYGKNIIGTNEAFMGYDVDYNKVGAKCETAEEFIKAINEFSKNFTNKFNEYSRNVFLEKYTDDAAFRKFAEVFREWEK